MNAEQQKRLHELALIMLRDAHGEDFTDEQAALLPAQIEEYQRLSEAQNILSLLEEICRLRVQIEQLLQDKVRLDSGRIVTNDRNEFGESYKTERRGMNLRASIDEAMAMHARDIANG